METDTERDIEELAEEQNKQEETSYASQEISYALSPILSSFETEEDCWDCKEQKKRQSMMNVLQRPFPAVAVKKRKGGHGKELDYLEGHTVILRVLEANPTWDWYINEPKEISLGIGKDGKEQKCMMILGTLVIPGLGSRQGVGVQRIDQGGGEDLVKGAATDAFKNATKYFGVGLHLYGENYEKISAREELRRTLMKQPAMKPQMSEWVRSYLDGETLDEQTAGSIRRLTKALKAQFPEIPVEESNTRK